MKRKKFAIILALAVVFGLAHTAQANSLSREEAARLILQAAEKYKPQPAAEDFLVGSGDSDLNLTEPATYIEVLAMVERAFGLLPEMTNDSKNVLIQDIPWYEAPLWARDTISLAAKQGLIIGEEILDKEIDAKTLDVLLKRVYKLSGMRLEDDFYGAVNQNFLQQAVLAEGQRIAGGIYSLNERNQKRLVQLVNEAAETSSPNEQQRRIADFYQALLANDERNRRADAPIKVRVEAVKKAENLLELLRCDQSVAEQIGSFLLIDFAITQSLTDSSQHQLYFSSLSPYLEISAYQEQSNRYKAYEQYCHELLKLAGYTADEAERMTEDLLEMETDLAKAALEGKQQTSLSSQIETMTVDQLQGIFPQWDLTVILAQKNLAADDVMVGDKDLLPVEAKYFQPEKLGTLKAYLLVRYLDFAADFLDENWWAIKAEFEQSLFNLKAPQTFESRAMELTIKYCEDDLEQLYVEKFFSDNVKEEVAHWTEALINVYQKRINRLDWLSEKTKENAQKKLAAMTVKIGYPKQWNNNFAKVTFSKNCFANICFILKQKSIANSRLQYQIVNRDEWQMAAFAVNAYYSPINNEIVLPAGILQEPFYDEKMTISQKLGGIGTVIGHEISHAFDPNGAAFDEKGNLHNWWQKADQENFARLCQRLAAFYDQKEVYAGIENDGQLTLGENIADLGGMACALELLASQEEQSYEEYFCQQAEIWAITYQREEAIYRSHNDVHSLAKLRVNNLVVHFAPFYETFGVTVGDGMYLPPEKRIVIW